MSVYTIWSVTVFPCIKPWLCASLTYTWTLIKVLALEKATWSCPCENTGFGR